MGPSWETFGPSWHELPINTFNVFIIDLNDEIKEKHILTHRLQVTDSK